MRGRDVLIVFVRAPALGAVKRRLAAGIGAAAARRFYVATTQALLRAVARDARWRMVIAVTPDAAARRGRFWPPALRRIGQGDGDLGRRMERVMLRFPHRRVVLVGSDIPELAPRHVAQAFAALGRAELVFGPADDGGYWLVGARHGALARGLFRGVRWSGPCALADTLANAAGRNVAELETLSDIDDADDYGRWRTRQGEG